MALTLHDVIKNSYAKHGDQEKAFQDQGYEYDPELSSHNQQVYYNKNAEGNKKLLYSVSGSHNLSDWKTNFAVAIGQGKKTKRYNEAKDTLTKAKTKYGVDNATIAGHSLGGYMAGYVGNKNDNVLTLDKAATIGQKMRSNENAYRTGGDVVSALNAGSKRMTTLKNNKKNHLKESMDAGASIGSAIPKIGKVAGTVIGAGVGLIRNAFQSHRVSQIKNSNIFV